MVCSHPPALSLRYANSMNSNQEDLHLISEMGITPDVSIHAKKPTLKAAGLAVMAAVRMKKLADGWAANRKVHAQLVKTLEGMGRRSRKTNTPGRQQLSFAR